MTAWALQSTRASIDGPSQELHGEPAASSLAPGRIRRFGGNGFGGFRALTRMNQAKILPLATALSLTTSVMAGCEQTTSDPPPPTGIGGSESHSGFPTGGTPSLGEPHDTGGGDGSASGGEPSAGGGAPSDDGEVVPHPPSQYGNSAIHPEKLGIYMIPDIPAPYMEWEKTERSLAALHDLLPHAWIRWDNETGHVTDTPENVRRFVEAAEKVDIPMIVTASAVDGYNNWWANGHQQPSTSIVDIANGPYLTFAKELLDDHENVRLIETINEPDTIWFVADPDDPESWDYYMSKLYAATEHDYEHLLGPSAAFKGSNVWNDILERAEIPNFSYHTYSGFEGLEDVADRKVYVTEYGFDLPELVRDSPAQILADLWQVEKGGKLTGGIEMLFYVDLQKMMRADETEGDHFAFSGLLRTLIAYQALGDLSAKAYLDDSAPFFMATDDEHGETSILVWNHSESEVMSGTSFSVPGTSASLGSQLYLLAVHNQKSGAVTCTLLEEQSAVAATIEESQVEVEVTSLPVLEAALITTEPCFDLAH